MLFADLSLDRSPPLKSIIRYFLTGPLMAALMGIMIAVRNTDNPLQYGSTDVVAIAHLFTLGFITMTMIGSMLQMLPVMAGSPVENVKLVSSTVHTMLTMGIIFFAVLFYTAHQSLIYAAALIYAALSLHAFSVLRALSKTGIRSGTARTMRLATAGLFFGMSAGLGLASIHSTGYLSEFYSVLFPSHLIWVLFGWIAVLLQGVSITLIPMFYVTSPFPPLMSRIQAPALFILCLLAPLFFLPAVPHAARLGLYIPIALILLTFGLETLYLLSRRGRKIPEQSIRFWQAGILFLILSIILFFTSLTQEGTVGAKMILLSGIFYIYGFIGSIVQGMLGRIVPFLSWLDLFTKDIGAPNVKKLLPDSRMKIQFALYLLSVATLTASVLTDASSTVAVGLSILCTHGVQFYNLLKAALPALRGGF